MDLVPGEQWLALYTAGDPKADEIDKLWTLPAVSFEAVVEGHWLGLVPFMGGFAAADSYEGFLCFLPAYMVEDASYLECFIFTFQKITGKRIKTNLPDVGPIPGETSH